jgi:hypothetical protein
MVLTSNVRFRALVCVVVILGSGGAACGCDALAGAASPGCKDFVLGCRGDCAFGDCEEFAADKPGDGGLGGAFGDADGFGEILIADGDGGAASLLLRGEPDVDEEAGGAAVMADEVAQEDVGDVGIKLEHGYTDG